MLPQGIGKKDHLLERNMDAGQAKKRKQPRERGMSVDPVRGVWLLVCFLLMVRFSQSLCLPPQAPSAVPILSPSAAL